MRVVALADTDSYVKWAAALLSRAPSDWQIELLIVRTAKEPSIGQLNGALHGTAFSASDVEYLELDDAIDRVARIAPDVVVVATIGPLADLLCEGVLASAIRRPVIVSGIPGIALPARRKALIYRSQVDLVVVHSKRERRHFTAIARNSELDHEFALATLPFLNVATSTPAHEDGDIIFAAQAIVPPLRVQRFELLEWLVASARSHPERRFVIKVRALEGEGQTHDESDGYPSLLGLIPDPPTNLVVDNGPMGARLLSARGLVTVSSTAAIEAIALGVPVLVVDDFGISPELINTVFVGSGLLGSARALDDSSFRHPEPDWLDENYFHAEGDGDWIEAVGRLVIRNRLGELAPRDRFVRGAGGTLRRAWDRKRVLGRYDRSLMGLVALMVGTPARATWLALGELRARFDDATPEPQPLPLEDAVAARPRADQPTRRTP